MSKKIKVLIAVCLLMGITAGLAEYTGPHLRASVRETEASEEILRAPDISAEGAILIEAGDGSVIYEKNADKKLYPASTTKIMTALTAFEIMDEIGADLDSCVLIPAAAAGEEGSSAYLREGEKVTLRELMYAMMLQSGNDAANAVAICCGGTMERFVERMNEKAKELGCTSTNFVNPSGLFKSEHYTTARDLSAISREALKTEEFRIIVSSGQWKSPDSGRIFRNKNKTIFEYDGATGIKIGFTEDSGRTLAASAKRDGRELIAVVLRAPDWFSDAYKLLDYGFAREASS